jgi:hypothetical protein
MAMLAMMPDDIAVMIYKEVFRSSLSLINKPKTQREYGFSYKRRTHHPSKPTSPWNYHIDKVIEYLNENVIQEPTILYDEDGDEVICMDYYVISKDGEKIVISQDQYDEDYDEYYKYVKGCSAMKNSKEIIGHNEISSDVIILALNLNPEDGAVDYWLVSHINQKIGRSNLRLRLSAINVPDDLPIHIQAFLMASQPKWDEGTLYVDSKN